MITLLFDIKIMKGFTYLLLFFTALLTVGQPAMAQTDTRDNVLSKDQKLIIQRNVIDPLRVSGHITRLSLPSHKKGKHKTHGLSAKDIRRLLKESKELEYIDKTSPSFSAYIPTNRLQKDLAFKTPTYYPSYYLNYQLKIKNISPKLLKVIKGGN